jgi:hypothetical protein
MLVNACKFVYCRGSQPSAREHNGALLMSDSALINSLIFGTSSRHTRIMPVFAGEECNYCSARRRKKVGNPWCGGSPNN